MKKIGLICLAVVLAVGVGGLAYATWSQTLTVTETVNTGEVEVGIRDVGTNDDTGDADGVPNASDSDFDPGWDTVGNVAVVYDKDVAHTESVNGAYKFTKEILINDVLTPTAFYHDVSDTIYSGYPCYAPTIVWEITNNGSIPVKLELTLGMVDPDGLDLFVHLPLWIAYLEGDEVGREYSLTTLITFLEGYQLEPCDTLRLELTKHILQWEDLDGDGVVDPGEECPMNATVTYTMTVNAVQWNLYSPPPRP